MRGSSRGGDNSLRIIVLGYIVRGPLGGLTWHHLQYVLGLRELGHEVWFLEDSGDAERPCYDPSLDLSSHDPSYGLLYTKRVMDITGMSDRWAYYNASVGKWMGPAAGRVMEVCKTSACVINLSGVNPIRPWLEAVPVRILIDTDPVFTQVRHLREPSRMKEALKHTGFYTFGENYSQPACCTPQDGLPWRATRQPVILDLWPVVSRPPASRFTTVMQWESYGAVEWCGQHYGMKAVSFPPYLDLPGRVPFPLELALGGGNSSHEQLRAQGWHLRDSREPTLDPWVYRDYVRDSTGEFSVAKQGYVATKSGWFSERSANYLASGRPVVTQETGFSTWLPAEEGVLAFDTPEEAADALMRADLDWPRQSRAARDLAAAFFDHRQILSELIVNAHSSEPEWTDGV